jgi:hypothetical protein
VPMLWCSGRHADEPEAAAVIFGETGDHNERIALDNLEAAVTAQEA